MNICERLSKQSHLHPNKKSIVYPASKLFGGYKYQSLTFVELENRIKRYASGFKRSGITRGTKTLVFIKPGLDFPAVTFALFKIGAVPVFIDPGMGKKNLLRAVEQIKPRALIAEPVVHILRKIYKKSFSNVDIFITRGPLAFGRTRSLKEWQSDRLDENLKTAEVKTDDLAAILFTSGGTGIPKGVAYTHGIFNAQTDMLQEMFDLTHEDVDLPGFPLFSMFTLCMGMTSVVPKMNPSKPGRANPEKLVRNILDSKATFVAGSPAIWERVANWCIKHGQTLPSVKYLVMFGAPVSLQLHKKFSPILTGGTTYTPYGATECLPVANAMGRDILLNWARPMNGGRGTCVGRPVPGVTIEIIPITDGAKEHIREEDFLPSGSIGEIVVTGPTVTPYYVDMPEKTFEAKMHDSEGRLWHRMGDIGYLDEDKYLWFCGRKTHRVETSQGLLSSIQCEAIFNQHKLVRRTALIGLGQPGHQEPALVIERKDGRVITGLEKRAFEDELMKLGEHYEHTKNIKRFYYKKAFPVDVRHNIKIDRLKLRDEAATGRIQ